jgi:predicted enzyme related to lactoylglutathione lyase
MARVTHFEINADDPKRAIKFYEKVFGWKITKWEGPVDYWLVTTGETDETGIDGAIMERMEKGAATCIFVDVPFVDEFLKKVVQADGKALTEKTAIPGVGYSAYCKDTEGNIFGIFQRDPSVK